MAARSHSELCTVRGHRVVVPLVLALSIGSGAGFAADRRTTPKPWGGYAGNLPNLAIRHKCRCGRLGTLRGYNNQQSDLNLPNSQIKRAQEELRNAGLYHGQDR